VTGGDDGCYGNKNQEVEHFGQGVVHETASEVDDVQNN
jgi:hypothetical protein